jgi:competence protein ComFC
MSLLDFIFPKYCVNCRKLGGYICDNCFVFISFNEISTCVVCQRPAFGGLTHSYCKTRYTIDGVFSSLVYKGVVKKLLYQFKYKPHVGDLRKVLGDLFYEGLIQKEGCYQLLTEASVIVPIPLYKTKLRSRGYNQSQLLADNLAKKCGMDVLHCLERIKNTHTQVGLPQQKRLENIKGAFVLTVDTLPDQVVLVDDVVTSGATLNEAAKILKKAGVKKVWGLTLAHGM